MCFMLSSTSVVDFLHATGQLDMTGSNTANLSGKSGGATPLLSRQQSSFLLQDLSWMVRM